MRSDGRREPAEILARARIVCLACNLVDGIEADAGLLAELEVEPYLTPEERRWFFDGAEPEYDVWWHAMAMLAMTWTLGLLGPLGESEFLDAFGEIANRLTFEQDLETHVAPREEAVVRAMMAHFEDYAHRGDELPPNERYGANAIRWYHAGLAWVMDPLLPWPPAPDAMLKVTERG